MQFIDTTIFLRHLTRDDPRQAAACFNLFRQAQRKKVFLMTSESVIAEVVYVLSSKNTYHVPRDQVRALLYPLLSLPGLKLPHRKVYLRALDLYANNSFDFEGCLIVAHMERQALHEVYSYDTQFEQFAALHRLEPPVENGSRPEP